MKLLGGRGRLAAVLMLAVGFLGCGLPAADAEPPLSVAAAQATLDSWNPSYCKVAEFYGLYKPEGGGIQVAYVNLVNPGDKAQKLTIYAATFQLLNRPDGKQQWFMTSLLTHGQGLFVKRQGWDNLMLPLKEAGAGKK